MAGCLAEDRLLELAEGRCSLASVPEAEHHLAGCATCSAVLAELVHSSDDDPVGPGPAFIGSSIGPYRIESRLGAGAMGEVYRAVDERLGRPVAIKVLPASFAADPSRVRRMAAEARAAAGIAHVNVVTVYDVGTHDGAPYIVHELITGESLHSRIARHAIDRAEALDLGLQLARGLAAAHARGVVHRDLKPHNLLVTGDGILKILDFGLAKRTEPDGERVDETRPGTVVGTSGYLSPEHARGEPADARSDVFAVGAILYEMLTGARAFDGASYAERLSAVLRDRPAGLDRGALGPAAPIVARCLEKDPDNRFQSAEDLAWALATLVERGSEVTGPAAVRAAAVSRRSFLLGVGAAATAGLALGRWLGAGGGGAAGPGEWSYRSLTHRQGRVTRARFTADGASAIYGASWDGRPIEVYLTRLAGGGTRTIAVPGSDLLAVSPRGEVALALEHHHDEGLRFAGRLAIVPIEGGQPRPLADDVQGADFGPDGELALIRRRGRRFTLELPLGNVLIDTDGWISSPRVSPDGRLVACFRHPSVLDDRGSVVAVERGSGQLRPLSDGWSSLGGCAWSGSGELWISGARDGMDAAVWAIRPGGQPRLIETATGRVRLDDLAADGRMLAAHVNWRMPMMVSAPGSTTERDRSLTDVSFVTDMSADGRLVVCAELAGLDSMNGAYVRRTDGRPPLRLGPGFPHGLSGDGQRAIVQLPGPPPRLVTYSTSAGDQQPIDTGSLDSLTWACWLDSDTVALGGAEPGRPPRIWLTGAGPHRMVALTAEGVHGIGRASQGSKTLAFVTAGGELLAVEGWPGAAPRTIATGLTGEHVCGWTGDGAAVFLYSRAMPIRVRRVSIHDGQVTDHATIDPPATGRRGLDSFVISAAGDAYAYSFGQELSRLYLATQ